MILLSILLAFLSSFIFSFLLETCAGIIITITMIAFYLGLGFLTYVTYTKKKYHQDIFDKNNTETVSEKLAKFFKICFYICVTTLSITLCFLLCFFTRIVLAVKIIKVNPILNEKYIFYSHFIYLLGCC